MEKSPKYLKENEVSEITGISLGKLRNDRFEHRGMPYCKLGKSVRYRLEDVLSYMDQRLVTPEVK